MRNQILFVLSTLAILMHPLSLSAQNSFSLSLDADSAAGDQAVTSVTVSADEVVAIQIFGTDIQNASGVSVRFEYDATQVSYDGFDASTVLPSAQVLTEQGSAFVEIGIVSFGGQATVNSGLIGTIRFRTLAAFSGSAIRLVRGELARGGQSQTVSLNLRVELQLQGDLLIPDFDGDSRVGFSDFVLFGGQYGSRQGDGTYEAKYDLDSNGVIGFSDFVIFGSSYGKEISTAIPDANLRAVIEDRLGKSSGAPITREEMATLTELKASNADIRDLTGLEFATSLTELSLGNNSISDISVLSGLINLESLGLGNNSISDLSPLSGLTNLESLGLQNNNISNVSALSGLTNLTWLHLGFGSVDGAVVNNNSISDLSPLSNLTSLTKLFLDNNNISDVSHLSNLTSLTELLLFANSISDISALSGLTRLEVLWIFDNNISDVSHLSGLTNLEKLWIGNNISDVSPLSGLTSLIVLHLSSNNISDVSALSNLTSLTRLHIGSNSISDVSHLSGLANLKRLSLSNNSISDVSDLSGLTSLEQLYLDNNSISDIAPLVSNTGLGSGDYINMWNNPLSDTSLNTHIPALRDRGINVQYGTSKSAVEQDILRGIMELLEGKEWEAGDYIYRGR